jgi:hypothetical protein
MRFIKAVAVFLLLCGTFAAPQAHAQKILERFKTPLPEIPFMEQAAFEAATTLYNETPHEDAILSYQIRLPKGWEHLTESGQGDYSLSSTVLGEIARFYGPPKLEARSEFSIQAMQLQYQIGAPQWLLQYVLSNGYTLEGIKIYDDKKVEGLYVMIDGDISYYVRVVAQVNEKRMILAQYFVPSQYWEEEKQLQAQAMSTFQLNNIKDILIEEMASFQFLDISEFKYPASWDLRASSLRSIDRMNAGLLNKPNPETVDGQIEIELISHFVTESLTTEIKTFKKKMEERGMTFGRLIEKREDYDFDVLIDFALTEVYEVSDRQSGMQNYEYWFCVMSSGEYYYFVTLLTPARDVDFFVWSRNTETYKLVLESLTPQKDSLAGD